MDKSTYLEKIVDAATGGAVSMILEKLKSVTYNSEIAIKLRDKFRDSNEDTPTNELKLYIRTIYIRTFTEFDLTGEQIEDLRNCPEFQDQIADWILNPPSDIDNTASHVDYSRWQFTSNNLDFRRILTITLEEIVKLHDEILSVTDKIIRNEIRNVPEQTATIIFSELRKTETELDRIKELVKVGKVKSAFAKIEMLRRVHISTNTPDETLAKLLEVLLECQSRLPYTIPDEDRISTLYELLRHVKEEVRKEKIRCLIEHIQQHHDKAIKHIRIAHSLSHQDPLVNQLMFIMLCNTDGKVVAQKFINNINSEIIEKRKFEFARCYYEVNNLDKAEELLNSFQSENSHNIDCSVLSAEIQMKRLHITIESEDSENFLSEQQVKELERRLDLVEHNLCEEDERNVFILNELRGVVLSQRGKLQDAIKYFERAFNVFPNDNFVNWNLSELYNAIGTPEKALVHVDKLPDTFEQQSKRLLLLIKVGQPETALDRIDIFLLDKNTTPEQKVELYELKVYALSKLMRASAIRNIYDILKNEYSVIQYSYKVLADIHKRRNGTEDKQAIECLQNGIAIDPKSEDADAMRQILFSLLSKSKKSEDINQAIEIGKLIFSPIKSDDRIYQYIQLLFDSDQYEECLNLVREIELSQGFVIEAKKVESIILCNKKEFLQCEKVCRDIVKQSQTEIQTLKILVHCLYHLSKYTDVKDILETAYSHLSKDPFFLQLGSDIYFSLHSKLDQPELLNNSLSYAKQYVEVDRYSKESVDYFISKLIPCSVHRSEIFDNTYLILGRELLNNYHDMFPASESLEIIDVLDDVEGFIDKMKTYLMQRRELFENIFRTYSQGKLPLSFIYTVTNKDYFCTWNAVRHTPSLKIWLDSTATDSIEMQHPFLANRPEVIITLHSFILLHSLDLLELISNVCSLNISQSSYTYLSKEINNLQRMARDGSKTIAYYNNQLIFDETNASIHKQELLFLETLLSFINKNCKILGHLALQFDREENTDLVDVLGEESVEFIFSRNTDLVYYSDDWFIRHSSSSIQGRKNMYIVPFLEFLLNNSKIERSLYDESIIKLVRWNYYIIPLELETIQYAVYTSNFTISIDVKVCFDLMYDTNLDTNYVADTLLSLTEWIWSECLISNNRVILTDQILDILSFRTSRTVALHFFEKNIDFLVHPLNSFLQGELRNYINKHKKFAIQTLKS